MAEFERAITDRTKAVLICNQAVGRNQVPDSALEALAALVQEDLFLFMDEVYREFV